MSLSDQSLAIVYHSPYGHTAKVADFIAQGARKVGVQVHLMDIEHLDWEALDAAQAIVFGCPTYMGNLTSGLKLFMEQSSKRWLARSWQGKLAAGFTNGGGLSGDKLAVLQQINLFAMQHGMLWSGLPMMPTGRGTQDLNRMSSFLGLMTQSDNAPVEVTPPSGDLETALWFGEYLGLLLSRLK
ncbi:flavodoxin family protein [Acinetobacter cumulans]|uniref:Flavodoxin family protein n=1 Tax=Acinetobacter cumulans TaxID=2136182 RepID=A0A3A8GCL0_9GAMM|nr:MULTISPECIES: flavodoxin family protein [Acinetobacter]NWK73882.1 flavodoxin family protein [Acinetobacter sp. SwsAc6]RFS36167.1 flavodoxin family protein [Acinetobacter sp. SWAC5]RKG46275.1 flavodoxin family protein [Acinetobacter cumulans]RKG51531.1 flavodoxin family protein [Acinetobacter cumulans]RLL35558.1 flavodoxin family protein [Acinetobacter cumulans]